MELIVRCCVLHADVEYSCHRNCNNVICILNSPPEERKAVIKVSAPDMDQHRQDKDDGMESIHCL